MPLLRLTIPIFAALKVGETYADVKLSDLGAARNVKTKEEYTYIATKEHLPARWLPLEAIRDAAFSHKSDVFSFAVLMWEICSLGKPPCESLLAMPRWLAATPGMSQNASISVFAAWRLAWRR